MKTNLYSASVLVCLALLAGSCKKEDGGSGVKAVFSYVADGYKVSFTNFSTNAKTYAWDFGNGTSTAKAPQHVFTAKGDYLVTLTVSNGAETSVFKDTVTIIGPNIKIDNDLTDWQYVSYAQENPADDPGTLRAVKTFAGPNDIFFYIEGTADMQLAIIDLYIDTDNNPATGYNTWMYPAGSGADYLLEGPAVQGGWGSVLKHTGGPADFNFPFSSSFAESMVFGPLTTVSGKKVMEFSVKKSALNVKSGAINFAFFDISAGWAEMGKIPQAALPASKFIRIPL
jgi:PKD repeat protein